MKTKLTLLTILISLVAFSQAPPWQWAETAGINWNEVGHSCSVDKNGNVYAVGRYDGASVTFGTTTLINSDISSQTEEIFIVKYDELGNVIWAKTAGGTSNEYPLSCSTDTNGNLYVTGYFQSAAAVFDTITLTQTFNAYLNMFIVKYDPNGNVIWGHSAGGSASDGGQSCAVDKNGNVIVSGFFQSPSITFGTTTLTNAGGSDVFIVKYDPLGNVIWARSSAGNSPDGGCSCSLDTAGNIFVSGSFKSPILSFGTTNLNNSDVSGTTKDMFVVKYDPAGNVIWANAAGGNKDEVGYGCAATKNGAVYITGSFNSSSLPFAYDVLHNTPNIYNYTDVFILKYDPLGNPLWARSSGGADNDYGISCSCDNSGNVILTGPYTSPIMIFGSDTLVNYDNTSSSSDIFLVKYEPTGNVFWSTTVGGDWDDGVNCCTSDRKGKVYLTGGFMSSTIDFGINTLTNIGTNDFFIAKLDTSFGASISSFYVPCDQPCSGSATANPNLGAAPYSYHWSNSQTTQTISGLCVGTYSVLVIDANNDSITSSVNISNYPLPTVTYNQFQTDMCISGGPQPLGQGYPLGGTYSGPTVVGNMFDPSLAGLGNFQIIYSFTDQNGCTNSDTAYITVHPLPVVSYNQVQTVMCVNWPVQTLTPGSPPGGNYLGMGVYLNTFNPYLSGVGTFQIIYVFNDGYCGNSDTSYITVNACAGVEAIENNFQFSISPNPSSGKFVIDSEITKGEIEIYNSIGEKVYSSEIISGRSEIDLSNKTKGIYFIKIQGEGKVSSKKIILE